MTRLRIVRLLPRPGELVVSRGQEVSPAQVVARCPEASGYQIFNASEALAIEPDKLTEHVLVEEGEQIFRGKPLVRIPALVGRGREYRSGVDGVFDSVREGYLVFQQYPRRLELRAMVKARVAGLIAGRGVILETSGSLLEGLWHSGHEAFGRLQVLARSADEVLSLTAADGALRDSVVVAGRIEAPDVLENLIDRGVAGLVAGSMRAELCARAARAGLAVILTDGIGRRAMSYPMFELLAQTEGKEASLIAGGPAKSQGRPKVVVPIAAEAPLAEAADEGIGLDIGQTVRVWRHEEGPHVGRVVSLHSGGRPTPVGLLAPGAEVELGNGRPIYVPFTNIDLLIMR